MVFTKEPVKMTLIYGRSIANDPTTLNFIQRDYLTPLPLDQMRLNTNLKQNPGW